MTSPEVASRLRLVGDVTDGARLGAATEESALRTFENLDALHVDQVDVVIAGRELHRLIVEVQRDVRKRRRGRLRLVARAAAAQAAHEDVAGAGSVAAEGDVRGVLQQVVEAHDVQLLQLLRR